VCPACAKRAQVLRVRAQVLRGQTAANGQDTTELDMAIAELDDELTAAGIRGTLGRTTEALVAE
jgi:hypothetical protein